MGVRKGERLCSDVHCYDTPSCRSLPLLISATGSQGLLEAVGFGFERWHERVLECRMVGREREMEFVFEL
jgi:hypothetical protein